ncbi:hypothetical protein IJ541_04535 [bacterium]|nr:hypothetical protein [bacterium]
MKIIQIDGIKGLITTVFIGACLFAGFVVSPGYVAMSLWNKYLVTSYMLPSLDIFQGVLLWTIIVLIYCVMTGSGFAVSLRNTPELSDEELDSIIRSARLSTHMRMMNKLISKADRFENSRKNPFPPTNDVNSSITQQNNSDDKFTNLK